MKKKVFRICALSGLLLFLCVAAVSVSAERTEELTVFAKGYLTEVYGYTIEEADQFVFWDSGDGLFQYWPDKQHSEWVYEIQYDPVTGQVISASTPFYDGKFLYYPGEGTVRRVASTFVSHQWLEHWDEEAMKAFETEVTLFHDVHMTQKLRSGLEDRTLSATEAICEFFLSCYGEPELWTTAVTQWLDELMGKHDVDFFDKRAEETEPALHIRNGSNSADMTYFTNQIPEQLPVEAITEKGWRLLKGVLCDVQSSTQGDHQLAFTVFARGPERQVVLFSRNAGEKWKTVSYGNKMIAPGVDPKLVIKDIFIDPVLTLFYTVMDNFDLEATLYLSVGKCSLQECTFTNITTGDIFFIRYNGGDLGESWDWLEIKQDARNNGNNRCMASREYAAMMLSELPCDSVSMQQWQQYEPPEGYLMLRGVHLRSKTSSRSQDLGMFKAGTLVKYLGTEPGDPHPWVHARIGLLEGYISSEYVCIDDAGNPNRYGDTMLPMVKTQKDTALKKGMGWFSGTVVNVPAGTKMHVLAEYDRWYYGDIPRGDIGYLMDVDGTYGYIPKDQVTGSSLTDMDQ